MTWSEAARRAAAEARRRKSTQKVAVQGMRGGTVQVSRDVLAKKIRMHRQIDRERAGPADREGQTRGEYIRRANAQARKWGGVSAAQTSRGDAKMRSRKRGAHGGRVMRSY